MSLPFYRGSLFLTQFNFFGNWVPFYRVPLLFFFSRGPLFPKTKGSRLKLYFPSLLS